MQVQSLNGVPPPLRAVRNDDHRRENTIALGSARCDQCVRLREGNVGSKALVPKGSKGGAGLLTYVNVSARSDLRLNRAVLLVLYLATNGRRARYADDMITASHRGALVFRELPDADHEAS